MSDIDLEELLPRLGEVPLFDVRRLGEYDGSNGASCDPRQGHIPGAMHLDVDELLMTTEDELRSRLGLAEGAELVVYCHSGSRSELAAQALRALGYDAKNYRGSWHEYSRTDHPLET